MKILVLGSGGREHAIIRKLHESPKVSELFCTPGNGGILTLAKCFDVKVSDITGVVDLAKKLAVDLVVVAPDDPLVLGMVDALQDAGIAAFGPNKVAAAIEGSKVFSKSLMKKYGIPTALYEVFDNANLASQYVKNNNKYPIVIKSDGLALGKGVIIAEDFSAAEIAIRSIMEGKIFGSSGDNIVIEEFLMGPEVSVLSFCDGDIVVPMVSSMDHKRAKDGDMGLNTGGMGTIAPNPFYTQKIADECMENIFIPTIQAMKSEGRPFRGCLYFGLILTADGVKVIEYNCRFGDPEAQVVLPLLESDLVDIFLACSENSKGKLGDLDIKWKDESAACVIMASGGYPEKYETGIKIMGLDSAGQIADAPTSQCQLPFVYHAGTKQLDDGLFYTSGGRVLGVTSTASTLKEALKKSYEAVNIISFEGSHFRTDIGRCMSI